ncbi:unnamed protein product [Rangifer tarandus platyrhynchus]|uniref:Uncharacterized protein n=1 Tax=Rangifer tarandus platyrhynchus TaxID=3082113 RepID=A0AC59YCK9_RANTA
MRVSLARVRAAVTLSFGSGSRRWQRCVSSSSPSGLPAGPCANLQPSGPTPPLPHSPSGRSRTAGAPCAAEV